MRKKITQKLKEFDVALSYATENEKYVKKVATYLQNKDIKVFFAPNSRIDMWGKDLYEYLDGIYRIRASYTIMFISKYYAKKLWTNHERKSAQARAFEENREYILPARFDNTEIPGIRPTISYINLKEIKPARLAEMINQKVGPFEKYNYLPLNIDRIFEVLKLKTKKEKARIETAISYLFQSFTLMTEEEREIICKAVMYSCSEAFPQNIHLRLEYLSRLTNKTESELKNILARLNSLDFLSTIDKEDHLHDRKIVLINNPEIIYIKFNPYFVFKFDNKYYDGRNSTIVLYGYYRCLKEHYCPTCLINAFRRNDFSGLNSEGYSEKIVKS